MEEILLNVNNICNYSIEASKTYNVPSREDSGLTFPYDDIKKGKIIETCVLFVDIRNSTRLSSYYAKNKELLGKLYSSFIYSMVSIADEFGYVRNIVGDRIMVVFEPDNCINSALNCAILMNTVHRKLQRGVYKDLNFRIGIGIDFGEMLILKTGIPKRDEERSENKGLVWIGNTANIASKLADISSKNVIEEKIRVSYEETFVSQIFKSPQGLSNTILGIIENNPMNKLYSSGDKIEEVFLKEFLEHSKIENNILLYKGNKVKDISKTYNTISTPSILMSLTFFRKFRIERIKIDYLGSINKIDIKNQIIGDIYGGDLLFSNSLK